MTTRRGLVVLGSTGSIGTQTLDVVRSIPDRFRVVGLAAGSNTELLARQIAEFRVPWVASGAPRPDLFADATVVPLEELVALPGVDLVVVATASTGALQATLNALELGRDVATANKEVLVAAGEIVVGAAKRSGARLLPIDSEHSAVWQCLRGEDGDGTTAGPTVERIVLTASGGAFRDLPLEAVRNATPADALRHPIWQMGAKITIDTATLVNKAFEVIEAHWLFGVGYDRIDVVLHRESVVHSVVQFRDGSSKAQLGLPDMRVPIQYALTFPDRVPGRVGNVDMSSLGTLSFGPIDRERYPAFDLVLEAGRRGGTFPAALSAANDLAVGAFLGGELRFGDIAEVLAAVLAAHPMVDRPRLDDVLEAERWAKRFFRGWQSARAERTPGRA